MIRGGKVPLKVIDAEASRLVGVFRRAQDACRQDRLEVSRRDETVAPPVAPAPPMIVPRGPPPAELIRVRRRSPSRPPPSGLPLRPASPIFLLHTRIISRDACGVRVRARSYVTARTAAHAADGRKDDAG